MHELRRHPRVEFARKAWCEHASFTLYVHVANVSVGGMFLQTSAAFQEGETVRVSLELEDQAQVTADMQIVWIGRRGRSPGVGCRVLRFSEGERAYVSLVERLAARVGEKSEA
jgi:Tfp pilus assembly protein PilZ